jgi:hypothetical protein
MLLLCWWMGCLSEWSLEWSFLLRWLWLMPWLLQLSAHWHGPAWHGMQVR